MAPAAAAYWAVGALVPVISALRLGRKGVKEDFGMGEDEDITSFKCERVCTSNRLLKRLGQLAKEPTPNTCVTVCGTNAMDACTEACQRAVCVNLHQVPAW
eukprot:CAMPEP_0198210894 /NCGR_PEP_ID=MMETSP1445-20131203/22506_1 /TAXON_ID=36898 /ORGANISM="Pyramimonas sp., Strain CCMP2087" /LENGTH=100 /DNA_ID=CAMNT_0043885059 /DNA_START=173 /DNA_END=472 /DNA_ORIENTATION=-